MKNVLVLGKFRPMHIGHEAMIDFARNVAGYYSNVHIVIADHDETFYMRYAILKRKYQEHPNIYVNAINDTHYQGENFDENGTCLDEGFMEKWAKLISNHVPSKITHVVSSDLYGKELAKALGAVWSPFDPDRELFPISATEIRESIPRYWDKIVSEFRSLYGISICVVGPESTGKSTLVKTLTKEYDWLYDNVGYVPEYGRIYSDHKEGDWNFLDFDAINTGQRSMIRSAQKQNILTFVDTEAYTTYLFGKLYLDNPGPELENLVDVASIIQDFDHYLLLKPNVKWVQDGQRILEKQEEREKFFNDMKDFLDENGFPYTIIDTQDWEHRRYVAMNIVDKVIDEKLSTLKY